VGFFGSWRVIFPCCVGAWYWHLVWLVVSMHWSFRNYFSVARDADVSRVSVFDDWCVEHWREIECGKGYRERRKEAILDIMDAIESGHEGGECAK
jgi:hypothetical protein